MRLLLRRLAGMRPRPRVLGLAGIVLLCVLLSMCQSPAPSATPSPVPATSAPQPTASPPPTGTAEATPYVPSVPVNGVVRGPYLQAVETDSIVVVWDTTSLTLGEVVYGETETYGSTATDRRTGTRHAVILRNLEPYTQYHYRIVSDGVPVGENVAFRTAADRSQTGFTFAVLGDTQSAYEAHREVVNRIVALKPDFVLHVGDLVQNGNAGIEWQAFFDIERELMARAPLFAALGNHERNNDMFFDSFYLPGNERWYVFDYGNARFVCLEVDNIADYDPESEQYVWLEKTLAANTQPWLIVFCHIPPYGSANDDSEERVRQILTPLIEEYGVDLVFGGHAHNYERNEVNGVTYIVAGGGGGSLMDMEDREPTQAAFAVEHHAVLVTVDGDQLRGMAIAPDGRVLDEFQRARR